MPYDSITWFMLIVPLVYLVVIKIVLAYFCHGYIAKILPLFMEEIIHTGPRRFGSTYKMMLNVQS